MKYVCRINRTIILYVYIWQPKVYEKKSDFDFEEYILITTLALDIQN